MTTTGNVNESSTFRRYCQTKKVASRETARIDAVCDATPKARDVKFRVIRKQHAGTKSSLQPLKWLHGPCEVICLTQRK